MKKDNNQEHSIITRSEPRGVWMWLHEKAQKLRAFLQSAGVEPTTVNAKQATFKEPAHLSSENLRKVAALVQDGCNDLSPFKEKSINLLESREEGILPTSYPSSCITAHSTRQRGNSPEGSIYSSWAPSSRAEQSVGMLSISRSSSMYYPQGRQDSQLRCSIGPRLASARSVKMLLRMSTVSSRRSRRVHSITAGTHDGGILVMEDRGLSDGLIGVLPPRCDNMSHGASQRSKPKSGCMSEDVSCHAPVSHLGRRGDSSRTLAISSRAHSCTPEDRPSWPRVADRHLRSSMSMTSAVPDVQEVDAEEVNRSMGGMRAALSSRDMVLQLTSSTHDSSQRLGHEMPRSRLQRNTSDRRGHVSLE
jgi:hypothetical protein